MKTALEQAKEMCDALNAVRVRTPNGIVRFEPLAVYNRAYAEVNMTGLAFETIVQLMPVMERFDAGIGMNPKHNNSMCVMMR